MREILSSSKEPCLNSGAWNSPSVWLTRWLIWRGKDPIDLELDQRHAARPDGEFAFAAQGEQPAVALDFDFLRQLRRGNDIREIFREVVTAPRAQALVDPDVELAVAFELEFEMMVAGMFFFGGNGGELNDCRLLEDFVGDFIGVGPFCRGGSISRILTSPPRFHFLRSAVSSSAFSSVASSVFSGSRLGRR